MLVAGGRSRWHFPKSHSKAQLLTRAAAGNRAAEHHSDPSVGLSPLADTDGEVTNATNLSCYMQDPDFGYQDFARRDEDQTQVFRVQVRFLLSQWAAAHAATSPLFCTPGGKQTVMGVLVQPRSGTAAFSKCPSGETQF